MKNTKLSIILLILFFGVLPLRGQNVVRDSLIDESMKEFFSNHEDIMTLYGDCMIDKNTFPYDYDLSKWTSEYNIRIVYLNNNKILKRYKKTKKGIPTICFNWKMNQDGSVSIYIALYHVMIKRNKIHYAFVEVCVYCYKYSNSKMQWERITNRCDGV